MQRFLPLILLAIILTSCLTSTGLEYEVMSETNQYRLARVQKGMSEKQVLQIMHKPYSYETFQIDEDIYDVWFYVTRPTGLNQTRMVAQNLTPLTFKNGVLVGTGYQWYYYAMKEEAAEMAAQTTQPEKMKSQQVEDIEFEKALKTRPEQESPQNQSAPKPSEQEDKNLPPNVRIISQNEMVLETPCGTCPDKACDSSRFATLSRGMSESRVFRILGEPLKNETFQIDGAIYDIWFYDTIASKTGKLSLVPQNQTILTFKNAVLISMDDHDFYELKAKLEKSQEEEAARKETPLVLPAPPKGRIFKPFVPKTVLGSISQKKFSKIYKGMTEAEVMKAIGVTEKQEQYSIGEDSYAIWFYEVGKNNRIVPLTFKNGVLVGMRAEDYNSVKEKAGQERIDGYDEAGERGEEEESEQNFDYW